MDTIRQRSSCERRRLRAMPPPSRFPGLCRRMARVVTLPKTTEQAERVIGLVILRLNVLLGRQAPDEVWAIARRAKASTHSA
jgi:hypothetical protein